MKHQDNHSHCINCEESLLPSYSYCPVCGNKVIKKRLTVRSVLGEFISRYFSIDSLFFLTAWKLIVNPGAVIQSYLDGNRKKFMHPFPIMIVTITLYLIFLYFGKEALNEYYDGIMAMTNENAPVNPAQNTLEFFTRYYNIISFAIIPILAALSYFVFRKYDFSYVEHNIVQIYASAGYNLMSFVLGIIGLLISAEVLSAVQSILMIAAFVYYPWVFKDLLKLNLGQTILRTLLFLIVLLFLFVISIVIIALGVAFWKNKFS